MNLQNCTVHEHTGPDGEHCFWSVRDENDIIIGSTWTQDRDTGKPLATLWAAAPDLLAAIRHVLDKSYQAGDGPRCTLNKWDLIILSNAIAKAEGGAQ